MGAGEGLRYARSLVRPAPLRRVIAAVAVVTLGLVMGACDSTQPYAVIVNGTRVSQAHLFQELRALNANAAFVNEYNQSAQQNGRDPITSAAGTAAKPSFSQSFVAVVLGTDVQAAVVHAEIVKRHIQPNAQAVAAAEATAGQQFGTGPDGKPVYGGFSPWFRNLFDTRQAETDALRTALGGPAAADDAAVQKFYNDNQKDFITTQCVSHILVKTQAEAAAIKAQIDAGADFATLAKAKSIDPGSAAKGGDLGCAKPGGFVAEFENVADTIAVNKVSDPVQSQFGFHIIKVTSRTVQPLDAQTKAAIVQQLQSQSDPLSAFFQNSAKTLKVQVNPAYGTWDTQQLQIVPPTSPGANSGKPAAPSTTVAVPAQGQAPAQGQVPAPGQTPGQTPSSTPDTAPASPPTSTP